MQEFISNRAKQIDASGIRKMFELSRDLKNPINFSIGEPHFCIPEEIKAEACRAIQEDFNKYTVTQGIAELKSIVMQSLKASRNIPIDDVLITSGVSGALTLAILATVDHGDEVLITDPYFVSYKHLIRMAGGIPRFINTYPDFSIRKEELEKAYTSKCKVMLVNSPNNPTGKVYSMDELTVIANFAREKNLLLISDEIYDLFVYDDVFRSIASLYEKTIILGGFSKTYAMPGWRVGYAAGSKTILEQMIKLQQYTFVSAPSPFQKALLKLASVNVEPYREEYRMKRDMVYLGLKDKYNLIQPGGAFYAFVPVPMEFPSLMDFIQRAFKKDLLIVPGNVLSERATHFRMAFAMDNDKLKRGIDLLNQVSMSD